MLNLSTTTHPTLYLLPPKTLFSDPPSKPFNTHSSLTLKTHSSPPKPHLFHSNPSGSLPRRPNPFAVRAFSGEGLQSVLEAASVLTAIIVVHEGGHFAAAAVQGIHVSRFAIGFGPVLARFVSNNVEYSLRAFPLGGFVGFPDNDPDSNIPPDDTDLLKNRPILDRLIVISAGVVANIVFAYLIIFVQVVSVGLPVQEPFPGVLVPEVRASSAAARDGLLPGDSNDGTGRIGVQLSPNLKISKVKPQNLAVAAVYASKEFWGLTLNVLDSLKQTFLNFSQSVGKVSGPVAIIAVGAEVARSSSDGLFQFAAILNINLAIINLLPLPALDGGSMALLIVEAVRGGRKLPQEVEQRIMSSGIMLVILLGLFLIVRDTLNLDFIKEIL
ncbi:hypothetical protein QJS10_CPA01g00867 [Acorus calamus]|uniref:Peptidase M50 domain-containing protein n=1 Tax=Acorus calamus TaxID=4465 RepID=A0AAV9FH23_ACOCL|nr:hypothetical protein QJS10_CPA01g00867 [Acorus calamus]